jgi:hypothetical protein
MRYRSEGDNVTTLVPLVSEQLFHEASNVIFSTSTFLFNHSDVFRAFATSPHTLAFRQQIQNLHLHSQYAQFFFDWERYGALEFDIWHGSTSLNGLNLRIETGHADRESFGPKARVIWDKIWKDRVVRNLICVAKQHDLKGTKTSIEFAALLYPSHKEKPRVMTMDNDVDNEAVVQQIRGHLHKHRPVRRSGRERKKVWVPRGELERTGAQNLISGV